MRIDTWDLGFLESFRQRRKPALWFPFFGVLTPEFLVGVAQLVRAEDESSPWDKYLVDETTVLFVEGLRQRQHDVFRGSSNREMRILSNVDIVKRNVLSRSERNRRISDVVSSDKADFRGLQDLHAQGFPADCIEIREVYESVVSDVLSIARIDDFPPELFLNIGMFGQKLKHACQRVGGGVHGSKDQRPESD